MYNITDLVKNKTAHFESAYDGNLWYVTDDGFRFPIPFEDVKGGVFKREDKAITLMRWIRKEVERRAQE